MLRSFGATIGKGVHIHPTVRITIPWTLTIADYAAIGDHAILYSLGPISIGQSTTISQNAHLCAGTHDYLESEMPLLKPPITIEAGAWICADAFVGPGVTIGENAIVGARSVVFGDVERDMIVRGNPATSLKKRRFRPSRINEK